MPIVVCVSLRFAFCNRYYQASNTQVTKKPLRWTTARGPAPLATKPEEDYGDRGLFDLNLSTMYKLHFFLLTEVVVERIEITVSNLNGTSKRKFAKFVCAMRIDANLGDNVTGCCVVPKIGDLPM